MELKNYFIHGLEPGSFFTCMYANDLSGAASHSHQLNEWSELRAVMMWLIDNAPNEAWGNYEHVKSWLGKSAQERFDVCHAKGWVMTDKELSWALILADQELI